MFDYQQHADGKEKPKYGKPYMTFHQSNMVVFEEAAFPFVHGDAFGFYDGT